MVQLDSGNAEHEEIDPEIFHRGSGPEDIAMVCNQGFIVNDDNEPDPENIRAQPDAENLYPGQTWGV